ISHDLAVVSAIANRVAVIHRGRIVEQGPIREVFEAPQDPYTRMLLEAVPRPDHRIVTTQPEAHADPLLAAQKIGVVYGRKSFLASLLGRAQDRFTGNREVSLTIRPGEILGIVGES